VAIPRFRLRTGGQEVALADRLLELRVTVSADRASDSLELTLDDRDPRLAIPPPGRELELWLGYHDPLRDPTAAADDGLSYLGKYLHSELDLELAPARLALRAQAADFTADSRFKAPTTRAWPDDVALGAIVAEIAGAHGYEPKVAPELSAVRIRHLDQAGESDLALLTRLGEEYDAVAKAVGGYLLFAVAGAARSAGAGTPLPAVVVRPDAVISGRATFRERSKYRSAVAKYHDLDAGETVAVAAGDGEPVFEVARACPDRAAAEAAAAATFARLQRGSGELSLTVLGDPSIVAETPLRMAGWRDGANASWTVTRAVHSLGSSGFRTEITAELPLPEA